MTEQVHMAEDVIWQSKQSGNNFSVFPEESLHTLAGTGIDNALTNLSTRKLIDSMGKRVGAIGEHGVVREVKGRPGLVIKISELPFSYSAINVALEAGLKDHRYQTPNYLGIMALTRGSGESAEHRTATVMSRAPGVPLVDALSGEPSDEEYENFKKELVSSGSAALARVNIDPSLVSWDPNYNNFFVSRGGITLADTLREPVVILDQNAGRNLGVREWEAEARSGFQRDTRDIRAEQAADEAWGRFVEHQQAA